MDLLKDFNVNVQNEIRKVQEKKDTFNYENLCFEGGGIKGIAYVGATQLLSDLGLLDNCKRFAGTSAGSIVAALLAVRTPLNVIQEIAEDRIDRLLMDGWWVTGVYKVLNYLGFFPAKKLDRKLKDVFKKQCGDENITFMQVYKKYGTELCIVGTNLTMQTVEYFHPKTTPDVPVADAIRCSVALPVLIQPPIVKTNADLDQRYIDGGVLENYPLRVFDGWYLSMEKTDSFLHKFGKFASAFDGVNSKTLGLILYSGDEVEFQGSTRAFSKYNFHIPRPDTKLATERTKAAEDNLKRHKKSVELIGACERFMKILDEADEDKNGLITEEELQKVINKVCKEDIEHIFGSEMTISKIMTSVDHDVDGKISVREFLHYVNANCGVRLRMVEEGGSECTVNSVGSYVGAFMNTLANYSRRNTFKQGDWKRTVPIFVDYVTTQDFELEPEDKLFMRQQGALATLRFLANSGETECHVHSHSDETESHDHSGVTEGHDHTH